MPRYCFIFHNLFACRYDVLFSKPRSKERDGISAPLLNPMQNIRSPRYDTGRSFVGCVTVIIFLYEVWEETHR